MKTAYDHIKHLIGKTVPSFSYSGGDYRKWKTDAREKLTQLLGLDRFSLCDPLLQVEYTRELENATEIRFTFQSEPGYRVPCHLLLPKGVEKPPLMIALQGHSTGMHISLGRAKYPGDEEMIRGGDRDFCIRAVSEGFATIALEQRNFGECGGDENGPGCLEPALTALLMGRTTIAERVWDVMRLIDVVENHFADKVDVSCISLMGNSGGGTATVYTAALEDRLVLAMPSCAMCTFKDSIGAMYHCPCNYVPHLAEFFDMGDLMAMCAPKYFVQVNGVDDPIFPLSGAEEVFQKGFAAYQDLGIADKAILIKGQGDHRFYADDSWPVVHKMLGK